MEGEWEVQAGIALTDDTLCLGEFSGTFLDAHCGLRMLMSAARIS